MMQPDAMQPATYLSRDRYLGHGAILELAIRLLVHLASCRARTTGNEHTSEQACTRPGGLTVTATAEDQMSHAHDRDKVAATAAHKLF